MQTSLLIKDWLLLPRDRQQRLMETFHFSRSGGMEIADNKIISDGVHESDLEKMDMGKMIAFLGSEWLDFATPDLFDKLFTLTLSKLYGGQPDKRNVVEPSRTDNGSGSATDENGIGINTPETRTENPNPRRRGRPRKQKSVSEGVV